MRNNDGSIDTVDTSNHICNLVRAIYLDDPTLKSTMSFSLVPQPPQPQPQSMS